MANLEEKVKEFLSDEKKAEALENDEKFLDAVSGGTATPETIAQKFGELGLPLSDDEAVRVEKTTQKIFSIEPEQLADVELNSVTGGLNSSELYHGVAKLGVVSGAAGGVGC